MARREHSQIELYRKLENAGYPESEITQAIKWLGGHELQSDTRFGQSLARRRSRNYGDKAIAVELAQHGLGSLGCLFDADENLQSESQRIESWLQRKYLIRLESLFSQAGSLQRDPLFQLKVKAFRALSARGFGQSNIERAWNRFIDEFMSDRC